MSNQDTELFDLCKEVYERTGWDEELNWDKPSSLLFPYHCYEWDDNGYRTGEKWIANNYMIYMASAESHRIIPAYTSDYLLERLPNGVSVSKINKGMYGVWVVHRAKGTFNESDTPLKALLKLVIALSDAGELK